jgi:hypothetical protein
MAAAIDDLDGWMPVFDRRGLRHCHLLSWHVALCALSVGRIERARAANRAGVHRGEAWGRRSTWSPTREPFSSAGPLRRPTTNVAGLPT